MRVLATSLLLILTWATQESQCGVLPQVPKCCSESEEWNQGCGDIPMCPGTPITAGDYADEPWGDWPHAGGDDRDPCNLGQCTYPGLDQKDMDCG